MTTEKPPSKERFREETVYVEFRNAAELADRQSIPLYRTNMDEVIWFFSRALEDAGLRDELRRRRLRVVRAATPEDRR